MFKTQQPYTSHKHVHHPSFFFYNIFRLKIQLCFQLKANTHEFLRYRVQSGCLINYKDFYSKLKYAYFYVRLYQITDRI